MCESALQDRRTATRRKARDKFDNGIVFTAQSLEDNVILCATIDAMVRMLIVKDLIQSLFCRQSCRGGDLRLVVLFKVPTWTGCIQIGVTATDPRLFPGVLPTSAAHLKGCTWIYTGTHVFYNGRQIIEEYGREDLDQLGDGDSVGVVRKSDGSLHFVVNGVDQGVAAVNTPSRLFVILDLYGKCAQVTISEPVSVDTMSEDQSRSSAVIADYEDCCSTSLELKQTALELDFRMSSNFFCLFPDLFSLASPNALPLGDQIVPGLESIIGGLSPPAAYQSGAPPRLRDFHFMRHFRLSGRISSSSGLLDSEDEPLRFHDKCGSSISLTPDRMSAERIHPTQQFNNGIVMSSRALR